MRVREHLPSRRRGSLTSPVGKRRIDAHNENDFGVKCTILTIVGDVSARDALEAFWIFNRNSVMNNRSVIVVRMIFCRLCLIVHCRRIGVQYASFTFITFVLFII